MFNKNIIAASIAAAALGLSTVALADNAGTGLNVNNTQGFYVGVQGGIARADYGNDIKNFVAAFPSSSYHQGGFGGRAFAGWHFNQYFDTELGYDYLPNNKYSASDVFGNTVDFKQKTYAFDLVAKASLPLEMVSTSLSNFSVYVKGGAAYVHATTDVNANIATTAAAPIVPIDTNALIALGAGQVVTNVNGSISKSAVMPTYGAGVAYSFNKNVVLDLSWTQIYGKRTVDHTPMTNFLGLGLTYRFV